MTRPLFSWVASITNSKGETANIDMYGTVKRMREDGWVVVRVDLPVEQAGRMLASSPTSIHSPDKSK